MSALTRRQFVQRVGATAVGATVLAGVVLAKQPEFDPAGWVRRAEAMGILPFYQPEFGFQWLSKKGVETHYLDRFPGGAYERLRPEFSRLFDELRYGTTETRIDRARLEIWLHDNGYTLEYQKKRT